MLQLIKKDEYGSTSIVKRGEDINVLIKEAKRLVTEENMENALTYDEKLKNWQTAYIEFFDENGESTTELIFGGPKFNKMIAYSFDESGNSEEISLQHEKVLDPSDTKKKKQKPALVGIAYGIKIFVGHDNPKKGQLVPLYAKREFGNADIDYITPEVIEGKCVYYVQVLN